MDQRKQIINILNKIISANLIDDELDKKIIMEYEDLNERCDKVISKIKERKQKK